MANWPSVSSEGVVQREGDHRSDSLPNAERAGDFLTILMKAWVDDLRSHSRRKRLIAHREVDDALITPSNSPLMVAMVAMTGLTPRQLYDRMREASLNPQSRIDPAHAPRKQFITQDPRIPRLPDKRPSYIDPAQAKERKAEG